MKTTRVLPAGWIWSVLHAASAAAEDVYDLCGNRHPADEPCTFCVSRLRIRRGLKRAQKQLVAIQVELDKQAMRK